MGFTLRRNRIVLATLLVLVPVVLLLLRSDNEEKVYNVDTALDPSLLRRLKDIGIRIRDLESRNQELSQRLISLRTFQQRQRRRGNDTKNFRLGEMFNNSDGSLALPSIYNYLPHLLGSRRGLSLAYQESRERQGVSVAFGVPTIKRDKKNYLVDTLTSLISSTSGEEKNDSIIIVFIAEIEDPIYVKNLAKDIENRFQTSIDSGLLEIIVPEKEFYPNLNNLPKDAIHNDPPERVKWRTKQNLDFAFLMMYAQTKARFYVQLEDDIIASAGYVNTIKGFALQQETNKWVVLEFSSLGFIGKLFRSSDLLTLVEFVLMFHNDKPVDWLLDHYLWVKVCSPDKDNAHCRRQKSQLRIRFKPSLFQHVGKESSLPGKKQNLIDKDFKKGPLFQAHLNPKATAVTTIEVYQTHSIQRAYTGQTFFWGLAPQRGDVIRIMFKNSVPLKQFLFKTGNVEHPGDIFSDASVALLTSSQQNIKKRSTPPSDLDAESKRKFLQTEYEPADYVNVGTFLNGIAEGKVPDHIGDISEVMIRVNNHTGQNWVIISEIHLVTKPK